MSITTQVKVPRRAKPGEIVLVRAKLRHPMETGWRKNAAGETVPRNRIHTFVCEFQGDEIFRADLHSGISADPYLAFFTTASATGTFHFKWLEDSGNVYTKTAAMEVA